MPLDELTTNAQDLGLGNAPLRTVLLWHSMPEGGDHFDWMVARDSHETSPLITLRCETRLDQLGKGETAALQRIANHRAAYLQYEGPIAGNRGSVKRMNQGIVYSHAPAGPLGTILMEIEWGDDSMQKKKQKVAITPNNSTHWIATDVTI
jgi:hypothetical protein